MAEENLSQEEIDALIASKSGENEESTDEPAFSEGEEKEISVYDFSKPNRIPLEQQKTVSHIHESYARTLSLSLSAFLRMDVSIALQNVEQLTFSDYVNSLVNPTGIAAFDMQPLTGYGLIEVNSPVLYAVIDRMLGGEGVVPSNAKSFTDLEVAITKKFFTMLLGELKQSWSGVLSISFATQEVQTNPAFVRFIPMREACLVVTLKAKIADNSGLITLCIPYTNLEPISDKLGQQAHTKYSAKQSDEIQQAHKRNFGDVEMLLTAILGKVEITMADLLALQPGDVLDLGCKTQDPLTVRIAGKEKFEASPGLVGKFKGISIQKEISKRNPR